MKIYPSLTEDLTEWVQRQPVFFTGTAPTHAAHINVSPKGLADSHFAILGPNKCAYIDRTGSGCETISHAYENGRICLMFMSFGQAARILRLHCRASVVEWDQKEFPALVRQVSNGKQDAFAGARAVIVCDIWQVVTSCGYGVPRVKKSLYAPGDEAEDEPVPAAGDELSVFETRPTLNDWIVKQANANKVIPYQIEKNSSSIDGLPGLKSARRASGQSLWLENLRAKMRNVAAEKEALAAGFFLAILFYAGLSGIGMMGI
ncbi:pyridoxamine phosphate oxidase family protein [Stachybotrys elegans]|uniref:Pyridoxamine phosphate oxidase family protein n=1 Tax=Stachybotrys elegans TaxID=80388 RepID=A0A8K0SY68_9HYPO|nr:pyridoxamine phosphate oxidase family protein [Stachybotrys elegans]